MIPPKERYNSYCAGYCYTPNVLAYRVQRGDHLYPRLCDIRLEDVSVLIWHGDAVEQIVRDVRYLRLFRQTLVLLYRPSLLLFLLLRGRVMWWCRR